MADINPAAQPKPAGSPPAAVGASDAKKPPFGTSSASQTTPNAGYDAAAMQAITPLIGQVQRLMTSVGAASDIGKKLLKVLNILVDIAPAGTSTPAAEAQMIQQMAMRNTQQQNIQQQLKQPPQAGGAPGGSPMPPPAAGGPPGGSPMPRAA